MTGKEDIEGRSQPLIRGPESAEMTVAQCIWIGDEAALLRNKLCQVRPTTLTWYGLQGDEFFLCAVNLLVPER
jgi:hypothetical protein